MTSESSTHPTSTTGDSPAPVGPSGIFTGPPGAASSTPATLPTGRLMLWGAIGALIGAGLVAGPILALGRGAALVSALAGFGAGFGGPLILILAIRPGRPRGVQLWPFVLLGVQATSCLLVIGLTVLLYFSAPQGALDQLSLVASAGASFIGSWVGMVRVIGVRLRDVTEQAKREHSQDSSDKTSDQ